MQKYKNEDGKPIAHDGREIKDGDTIQAFVFGMEFMLHVYQDSDEDILHAKNESIQAHVEAICKGSDKVEITNR